MMSWEEEEGAECYEVHLVHEGSESHQPLTSKTVKAGVFEYTVNEDRPEFNDVDLCQDEVKVLIWSKDVEGQKSSKPLEHSMPLVSR